MLEFYDRFMYLCARHQMSPSAAANAIGLSNAAATGWKKGKVPSDITVAKLAQLFDVPVSYLTGKEEKENPTVQNVHKNNGGDLVFYDKFVYLCTQNNISPSAAAEAMGYQRSVVTRWSKGGSQRDATLQRVANYFGVPVSYLTGEEEQKENPTDQMGSEVSETAMELWDMLKDAPDDELRLMIKMYRAIRSERDNG